MQILKLIIAVLLLCPALPGKAAYAEAKIEVTTTTTVLEDLVRQIGGEHVEVHVIASPKRDLHKISPTPKDVLKTNKADVFIYHGLQAEPWLTPLLNAAGRPDFLSDDGRAIDASKHIKALEVPADVTRLEGDIHPHGNPHYWLNPENALIAAANIRDGLMRLYPESHAIFQSRYDAFQKQLDQKIKEWAQRMKAFEGMAIVTYHRSWSYFADSYGLKVVGEIEPKPGIPVTSQHLSRLTNIIREDKVKLLIKEPYQEKKTPQRLAQVSEAYVIELYQFNGALKNVSGYIDLIEYNISLIEQAMKGSR